MKHALQSLISACIRQGCVYMCHFLNALHAVPSLVSTVLLTVDMRADIEWWVYFLQHYDRVSIIPINVTVANPRLFACDACLTGCGAVCFGEYF